MRVTIKGLRRWILVAAVLLMAVVAGFVLYGRYRFRHIARDLPARLGVNIQQTATGFSYSQSSQGHTLFTLQASKEFQMKSGHVLLHNVDITLYGPPGSGRTDHIFGSDFDYDQAQGVAVSHGAVRIQLEGLGADGVNSGSGTAAGARNTIEVQTSGLMFVQKTEQASTARPVQFELPRASGSAVGAAYNAKTGSLVLNSEVHITTSSKGKTAKIGATHATMERAKMQALLTQATLDYQTEHGSADEATVEFRKDGTAEKIDARGHVRMATEQGAMAESGTGEIVLDAKSQPLEVDLEDGVRFAEAKAGGTMQGSAGEGTLLFAAAPGGKGATELRHAEFRQKVRFRQEVAAAAGDARGAGTRELEAEKVDVDFAPTAVGQPTEAQRATAVGRPALTMRQGARQGARPALARTTRISGDELVATLAAGNLLRELDGTGHTEIESTSSDGARETSRGDALRAIFGEEAAKGERGPDLRSAEAQEASRGDAGGRRGRSQAGPEMQAVLETAVQDGNVVLTEIPVPRAGGSSAGASAAGTAGNATAEPLTAWAEHAEYRAADEVLTLTGHPRMRQGETVQMSAQRIEYHRDTQDASAEGNVRATYTQPAQSAGAGRAVPRMGGNGPVYVIAERATMRHATGESTFYGTAQERARMWQGSDSLLAPTIAIDRSQDALRAWGESGGPQVLANFLSAMGAKHQQSMVSVESRRLDYSDRTRQANFQGQVTATQGDGAIHADDALVILTPEQEKSSAAAGKQNSQIEKVIATGHVMFAQPGRKGEGARLVYTAGDGKYVLTGTPEAPPRLWDREHGTTTGAALIFNNRNDSVEVSGGKSSAVTETRAPR